MGYLFVAGNMFHEDVRAAPPFLHRAWDLATIQIPGGRNVVSFIHRMYLHGGFALEIPGYHVGDLPFVNDGERTYERREFEFIPESEHRSISFSLSPFYPSVDLIKCWPKALPETNDSVRPVYTGFEPLREMVENGKFEPGNIVRILKDGKDSTHIFVGKGVHIPAGKGPQDGHDCYWLQTEAALVDAEPILSNNAKWLKDKLTVIPNP